MPGASDAMVSRLQSELDDRTQFQEGLIEAAQAANRDLNANEMELYNRAATRIGELDAQLDPLREGVRIAQQSRQRSAELQQQFARARGGPSPIEYRSAGAYVADLYLSQVGSSEASERLELFNRVAAHQTTADNPGLLPESIVGPVVNFVDTVRPLVQSIGVQDLGAGSWAFARVTQHTQVGKQSAEKTELPSRKMIVTKTPLGTGTYGGYVNVSRQDINRTSPAILDMVINDLAGQYAIETENEAADSLEAAAVAGPVIPATPTGLNIATAVWGAAGQVFAATKGQGRVVVAVAPDKLGVIGPLFPGVNPQNAYSTGFQAGNIAQGEQGNISGLTVVMSAGLTAGKIIVFSTAAVKAFEYKYGNLQVIEPSVLGVQVGYAGDFDTVVIEPNGVVNVTTGT